MQRIRDSRPWYLRGKVLSIADIDVYGIGYRHPVRPYTGSRYDNDLVRGLMRQGYTVVVVDYGYNFEIPQIYNIIPHGGQQLSLDI